MTSPACVRVQVSGEELSKLSLVDLVTSSWYYLTCGLIYMCVCVCVCSGDGREGEQVETRGHCDIIVMSVNV